MENDLQNTSWDDALEFHSNDVDKSFETFFRYTPLKKMSLKEHKLKVKSCLTTGMLSSIKGM